jgi:hypothetical protein
MDTLFGKKSNVHSGIKKLKLPLAQIMKLPKRARVEPKETEPLIVDVTENQIESFPISHHHEMRW